jgi:hypothetical protein
MWTTIGLLFGALTERSLTSRRSEGIALTKPARG